MEEEEKTSEDIGINSQKSEGKGQQITQKASQAKDRAKQVVDMAKKVSKKFNSGAAKAGKTIAKIASKLGPALPYVALAAVIIFVIIGICGFLATMPGLLTGKLKAIAQGVADWWEGLYATGASSTVNEDDEIDTIEYIKSMGYDLIGYGFIPAKDVLDDVKAKDGIYAVEDGEYYDKDDNKVTLSEDGKFKDAAGNEVSSAGEYYDRYGLMYGVGGTEEGAEGTFETAGKIKGFLNRKKNSKESIPDVSRIRTYLMADARGFTIRNYDHKVGVLNFVHDLFCENDEDWSKGLISLYHAENYIAISPYRRSEAGYIKINQKAKEMDVKVGWNSNSMKFQMDGWSGRYGLSLEFLLSLHLGTMAPELVSTIARTFDTEVQVYLDAVVQSVTGYYKDENSQYIKVQTFKDNSGGHIGNYDAYQILHNNDFKLESQTDGKFACKSVAVTTVVSNNGDHNVDKNYEDVLNDQHSCKEQMFIVDDGEKIGAKDWYEFITSDEYDDMIESDYDSGDTDESNSIESIAFYVNDILNQINTYNDKRR